VVKRSSKPDVWSLPGGLVELGEMQQNAAIREVQEETNINIKIIKFLENLDIIIKDEQKKIKRHYILAVFSGEYISGNIIAGDDALDAKWVPIQDIKNINMTIGTTQFIMNYCK
jgi:8-oxo-dGTP diphosphatase|tara:strand:+ start:9526 stop:9867 length:342 start_codon:yes stop_codon:yes gene_type:complete